MNTPVKFNKRLIAYLLDILIVTCLVSLIISIRAINPHYDEYIKYTEKYTATLEDYLKGNIDEETMINSSQKNYYYIAKYSVSYNIISIIVIIGYYVFFQKYTGGQTLGKKIMKIKVTNLNNEDPGLISYLIRAIILYFVYVGGIIPLIINTILVYILNSSNYLVVTSLINYLFVLLMFANLIVILVSKDKKGIHDIIAKTKVINEK